MAWFDRYIGIDYSGAGTTEKRSSTLQVYQADRDCLPRRVSSPESTTKRVRHWNRKTIAQWLIDQLKQAVDDNQRLIIGIDHGFSMPLAYFNRYRLSAWDAFLKDFVKHWPTHQAETTVEEFRQNSKRTGNAKQLRLTERWTCSAKSVFQFDVQGSVAKSTHAGLPFLHLMKTQQDVHVWPFDGWFVADNHRPVIAECFPSLFRNRFDREERSVDQQDAYAISRWMMEMDQHEQLPAFFNPPLSDEQKRVAEKEGWILGVY